MRSRAKASSAIVALICGIVLCLGASIASATSEVLTYFGTESGLGSLGAQFSSPREVAVNATGAGPADPGDVYVVDDANHRVQRFDKDGKFIWAIGRDVIASGKPGDLGDVFEKCVVAEDCKAGSFGLATDAPAGELDNPQGIAVDQDTGLIYVSERDNRRIEVFDGDGSFVRTFGFDVIVSGKPNDNGALFEVCDTTNGNVEADCKIGLGGAGVGQIGTLSALLSNALAVTITPPDGNPATGAVFLADTLNRRVNTYKLDGSSPASFGSAANFGANQPRKVAVDSRGILYASDDGNSGEIERYDTQGANGPVGFLAPILAKNSTPATGPLLQGNNAAGGLGATATSGLAVDPDSDGIGLDTDVLYVLRDPASEFGATVVQQFGPSNKPGLVTAPTAADDTHGKGAGFTTVNGLGLNDSDGRLYVSSPSLAASHRVWVLGFPLLPPGVSIDQVTTFTATTATFKGTVTTDKIEATYHFEYSEDGVNWIKVTPSEPKLPGDSTAHPVSVEVEDLIGLADYQVRLVATKALDGGSATAQTNFETGASPPVVTETAHIGVHDTSATLKGTILAHNQDAKYRFEYVDREGFEAEGFFGAASVPAPPGLVTGGKATKVEETIEGLEPNTTYHYRLTAFNVTGTTHGETLTFTTYLPLKEFGPCPNDALRAFAGEELPDCRAYEQASPIDKNGNNIYGNAESTTRASVNGDAVTFESHGVPGGEGAQEYPLYLASRNESGWSTQGVLPNAAAGDRAELEGWTPDFAHVFDSVQEIGGKGAAFVSRSSADGSLETIVDYVPSSPSYSLVGPSADGSRVFFQSRDPIDLPLGQPTPALDKWNLYAWDHEDGLSLAGVLPDDSVPTEGATAGRSDSVNDYLQNQYAVSSDGDAVYFTDEGTGRLYLRQDPTDPVDAQTLHVSDSQKTVPDPEGPFPATFHAASTDGNYGFFTSSEELTDDAHTAATDAIGRVGLDGSDHEPLFLPADAEAVEVDGSFVYWLDAGANAIGRAELDGDNPEPNFIAGLGDSFDLAVDAGFIYWSDPAADAIGRAELDGDNPEPNFLVLPDVEPDPSGDPGGFVEPQPHGIDVRAGYVYWVARGGSTSGSGAEYRAIGRAQLPVNPSDPPTDLNPSFIDTQPNGFPALDVAVNATDIFWSVTEGGNTIGRANIDGSTPNYVCIEASGLDPRGLAVDASHVYWTNFSADTIGRANLDCSGADPTYIAGVTDSNGLAIDSTHLYWTNHPSGRGTDLYRYDATDDELTEFSPDSTDITGAEVRGVLGASRDGSRVYFVANGVLDDVTNSPNGEGESASRGNCQGDIKIVPATGTCNLYLAREDGGEIEVSFIAKLDTSGGRAGDVTNLVPTPALFLGKDFQKTSRVSPDGQTVLFRSQRQLTSYDNEGMSQLYRYRVGDPAPTCVSCNPTGARPADLGPPSLSSIIAPGVSSGAAPTLSRNLSADGNRVFFETPDSLVAADTNGDIGCPIVGTSKQNFRACNDAYMWEAEGTGSCDSDAENGGCLYLLSSGKSPEPSFFFDASASGDDAFIFTTSQLVRQDGDDLYDVYDASVEGGLASQNQPPLVGCEGEGCKAGAKEPAAQESAGSASFQGPPSVTPDRKIRRRCPQGKRKARVKGKARCVAKRNKRRNRANQTGRASR